LAPEIDLLWSSRSSTLGSIAAGSAGVVAALRALARGAFVRGALDRPVPLIALNLFVQAAECGR
jgi:hypothetical protein